MTIHADGHSEYDLESLKNDKRDYSNYINEIEGIAKHLNYDTQNLTGDQLGYIIENYIDVLFEYLNDNIFETLEEFTLNCEKYPYDTEIKKYLALPLELKKELFEKIG